MNARFAIAAILVVACSRSSHTSGGPARAGAPSSPTSVVTPPPRTPASAPPVLLPPPGTAAPTGTPPPGGPPPGSTEALATAATCTSLSVFASGGAPALVTVGHDFLVGATLHRGTGDFIALARVSNRQVVARSELVSPVRLGAVRHAAPAIAIHEGNVVIAFVAPSRKVLVTTCSIARAECRTTREVAVDADVRYAPALLSVANALVLAYTNATNPMHVSVVTVEPSNRPPQDVTPEGLSACCVSRIAGENAFIMLDPHEGISPLLRVTIDDSGRAQPTQTERAVGLVSTPTILAGVSVDGLAHVGYTAVGNAATTAIGMVRLGEWTDPVAIVRGTGYGDLSVTVARAGETALFAALAPTASPPDSPREVVVRAMRRGVLDPSTFTIPHSSGAGFPSIAVTPSVFGVAYATPSSVELFIECARN